MDRKFQATSAPKRNQFLLIREYVDDVIDKLQGIGRKARNAEALRDVADNWRALRLQSRHL